MDYNANEPDRRNVKTDMVMSVLLAVVAVVVYSMTMTKGVFPGESANLMAVACGFNSLELPFHPLFSAITAWLGGLSVFSVPVRLGMFSMLCAALAVVLVYRVTAFFIRDVITEETAYELAPRVSTMAGGVAAVAFLFSLPLWNAATRLQYQSFDVLFPLLAAQMLVLFAMHRWRVFLVLFAVICGVGAVEAPSTVPVLPVLVAFAFYVLWRAQGLSVPRIAWMLGLMVLTLLGFYYMVASSFFKAEDSAVLGFASVGDVMGQMMKAARQQLSVGFPKKGLLLLLLTGVVPWLTSMLAAFRGLNNERAMSQYFLHLALSLLVFASLANMEMSSWEILRGWGLLPVGRYAMTAMAAGYLFAYWYLLLKVRSQNRTHEISQTVHKTGEWMGILGAYPFAVIVVIASLLNTLECSSKRGMFADRCAKEILDRMGTRTWLVTDGTLDPHLQFMAKDRGMELNLICLQRDNSIPYRRSLWKLAEERQLFKEEDGRMMRNTLMELGVLPFIHDWFSKDDAIEAKAAVFSFSDLWFTQTLSPIPDFFMFGGCRDIKELKDRPLLDEYMAFWQSMDADLSLNKRNSDLKDPINRIRKDLRRHMGFVANNMGVLLEDLGNETDAFKAYNYVSKSIDSENVSALLNRVEMTRRDSDATVDSKDRIEKEVKEFLANLKHQYPLWSLSRYFGYVRAPEIFIRLGMNWAISGQMTAVKASIDYTTGLANEDQRIGVLQEIAAMFRAAGNSDEEEKAYDAILGQDSENRRAMIGKINLEIARGSLDKAKELLTKITKAENRAGVFGVEWATIHLMSTNVVQARVVLQETVDLNPKNLQALSMLALLQIQQGETDEVEGVLLNRMKTAAGGTDDNYFIHITRAQLYLKKGDAYRAQAREAFVRAAALRPDIPGVKDIILQLDMAMDDVSMAQLHARQVLRDNRDHALANYVIGSLRLREGYYGEAEDFLKRSVKTEGTAAALNDLAEVLRRIRRLDEAEMYAREAVAKWPGLYIAWETLGSILMEESKNLDEAEQAVEKALSLYADDLRVKITLARIQLKKGDIERARATIQQIDTQKSELAKFDLDVLAKLKDEAKAFQR